MNKNEKIYVAGHTGLVGSALMRCLGEYGFTNLVYKTFEELDLRNQYRVNEFFANEKPAYVFLAAAKVGGIIANSTYRAEFIYDNLMIASNIINAAYHNNIKKLINLGSSCIYPRNAPQPLKEAYLLTGPLEPTNEPYALAKIAAIKLCNAYNEQYGTQFLSVMPTNLYGPYDNFNLETSHVLPSLIRKFHLAKLLHERAFDLIRLDLSCYPIGHGHDTCWNMLTDQDLEALLDSIGITKHTVTLWGSGLPCREFLHVDDLAEALVFLMEHATTNDIGECINIGTGVDISINDCATKIKLLVGFQGNIKFDDTKPDGPARKVLDVSRLQTLGVRPKIEFENGIAELYTWYLNHTALAHSTAHCPSLPRGPHA